ncbi:MAG: BBP7 family outer membrane beta-barrel protein [Maioricimonas sp. JB049]
MHELLPPDRGFLYDHDSVLDQSIRDTMARAWIRLEYLNWSVSDPGGRLLGAPMATLDATSGVPAVGRGRARPNTIAFVPTMSGADFGDQNGIRGSFGIPTRVGSLEANVWALEQSQWRLRISPQVNAATGVVTIPAVSLRNNGRPADDRLVLFDDGYNASFRSDLMGTEGNFVFSPVTPNAPIIFQPIAGFRYMRLHEELQIRGSDEVTMTNPQIRSRSENNLFGPQVGFRAEVQHERFTLGVEPKFTFGFNRHSDQVLSEQIFEPTDANGNILRSVTGDDDSDFAPMFNVSTYARVHLTHRLSVFVGYDLMLAAEVSRPYSNIVYNDAGVGNPPGIVFRQEQRQDLIIHGLFVGGELRFK